MTYDKYVKFNPVPDLTAFVVVVAVVATIDYAILLHSILICEFHTEPKHSAKIWELLSALSQAMLSLFYRFFGHDACKLHFVTDLKCYQNVACDKRHPVDKRHHNQMRQKKIHLHFDHFRVANFHFQFK